MRAIRATSCEHCQNLETLEFLSRSHPGEKPPTPLKEPSSKEPKVPAGSKDPQVEVDEVRTEEYDRECEACNHFLSSNMYRRSHITRYHKALLRQCKMCKRLFMFPWDFDRHLDSLHSKCKVCQQYLVNEEMLLDHMALKHPTVTPEPVVTENQVTCPATLEADCPDHQVKCKYCDRLDSDFSSTGTSSSDHGTSISGWFLFTCLLSMYHLSLRCHSFYVMMILRACSSRTEGSRWLVVVLLIVFRFSLCLVSCCVYR